MNLKPLHRQLALAAIAALALGAGVAHADEVVCNGRIDAVSIDGDVKVPSNVACTLAGTRVDGNVKVESGASLATQNARIGGNVQAENHRQVNLAGGAVGGSVRRRCATTASTATCSASRTAPRPPAVATSCRATRKTSARDCNAPRHAFSLIASGARPMGAEGR